MAALVTPGMAHGIANTEHYFPFRCEQKNPFGFLLFSENRY